MESGGVPTGRFLTGDVVKDANFPNGPRGVDDDLCHIDAQGRVRLAAKLSICNKGALEARDSESRDGFRRASGREIAPSIERSGLDFDGGEDAAIEDDDVKLTFATAKVPREDRGAEFRIFLGDARLAPGSERKLLTAPEQAREEPLTDAPTRVEASVQVLTWGRACQGSKRARTIPIDSFLLTVSF